MRCSIERRASGKWTVRYSFVSGDGRRLFRRVTLNAATRKDAEGLAARIAADLSRGTYADAGHMTIAHLCNEWLTEKRAHLSPTTVERYEGIVNLHIKPILGATRLRDLKRRHISDTLLEWQTRPRRDKRKGGLTSTSVRHNFTTLSTVLHFAVQSGYLATNPCQNIKPPARSTEEVKLLPLDELRVLVEKADSEMAAALLTEVGTGLRRGELLGLRWADVSLDDALLRVRQALSVSRTGLVVKRPKSKKSIRTLALPPYAVAVLRVHDARQAERYSALGRTRSGETPVFDWIGDFWNPTNFSSMFYRLRRKAGVACRFHDLRHAFASTLLQQRVNLKVASHLLGHASIAITGDIYTHVIQEQAREAATAIETALGSLTSAAPSNGVTRRLFDR